MNENKMLGLAWISPYIIGLIVFTAFPFVSSFFLSFTEYDLMSPPVFNGIENYRYMLTEDGLFWKSMGVTPTISPRYSVARWRLPYCGARCLLSTAC